MFTGSSDIRVIIIIIELLTEGLEYLTSSRCLEFHGCGKY